MKILPLKIRYHLYLIPIVYILISCGNAVEIEPQDPDNINPPVTDKYSPIPSYHFTPNDWDEVKRYFLRNPELTKNTEYMLYKSTGSFTKGNKYKLYDSDYPFIQLSSTPYSKIIINEDKYKVWTQLLQFLLSNQDVFPQKNNSMTINNQVYNTITFTNIPAYIVLMLMDEFYLTNFTSKLETSFHTVYDHTNINSLDEYIVATHILYNLTDIESFIPNPAIKTYKATRNQIRRGVYNLLDELFSADTNSEIYKTYQDLLSTNKFFTVHELQIIAMMYSRKDKEKNFFNDFIFIKDAFLKSKSSPLLRIYDYLEESSKQTSNNEIIKKYQPGTLFNIENDIFTTSVTIIKENFIPIEFEIESTSTSDYHPKIKISISK